MSNDNKDIETVIKTVATNGTFFSSNFSTLLSVNGGTL